MKLVSQCESVPKKMARTRNLGAPALLVVAVAAAVLLVGFFGTNKWFDWTLGMDAGIAAGTLALACVTYLLVARTKEAAETAAAALGATKKATQLAAYIDLFAEYRSLGMRRARNRINHLDPCDREHGLSQLGQRDREAVELVSHYLDNIGVLVSQDLLEKEPAAAFLGGSALKMWTTLNLYIYAERQAEGRPTYQKHFEYLAAVLDASRHEWEGKIEALKALPPQGWGKASD